MNDQALVAGITALLGVVVYLYIGIRLARRTVSPEARLPAMQFAAFWIGIGASSALGGILSLIAVVQTPPLALVVAFLYYQLAVVCVALWGLVSYLAYLYTGRDLIVPITVLYVLEYALLTYYVSAGFPDRVSVTYGSVNPVYATTVSGLLVAVPILLLVFPELIAALAYFRLFFRTRDRTVRYRIALVSWGILAWFLLDFLNLGNDSGGNLFWLAVGRSLSLIAALVVLLAYYPPRMIRDRYQIARIA